MKKKIVKGIGIKLIAIGAVVILLLIGLSCIKEKVYDREYAFNDARSSIYGAAGGSTLVKGFYIDVPYTETDSVEKWRDKEKYYETVITHGTVVLEPEELVIQTQLNTNVKKLGIYSAPTFTGKVKISSNFDMNLKNYGIREYNFNKAKIYINIDERNLTTRPVFTVNDVKYRTEFLTYDSNSSVVKTGISSKTGNISVSTELDICGANTFEILPAKGSTKLDVQCDWPSPNFTNSSRLPSNHEISKEGFSASWFLPFSKGQDSHQYIGFQYINPVNLYSILLRSVTYGFLFIIIPFIAFFLFEIFAKVNFHPVQYLLSGAACAVFFLLLLSISEHTNFEAAYIIAASSVGLLVSLYTGMISKKIKLGFMMLPVLAALYGFLFFSLKSEDYALLIGSIFIFMIIAIVMFCTRKVDWSNLGKSNTKNEDEITVAEISENPYKENNLLQQND